MSDKRIYRVDAAGFGFEEFVQNDKFVYLMGADALDIFKGDSMYGMPSNGTWQKIELNNVVGMTNYDILLLAKDNSDSWDDLQNLIIAEETRIHESALALGYK